MERLGESINKPSPIPCDSPSLNTLFPKANKSTRTVWEMQHTITQGTHQKRLGNVNVFSAKRFLVHVVNTMTLSSIHRRKLGRPNPNLL